MSHTTDLGKDRIPILVLKLAIPSMIAQFVTVLYSIIDRMFIGNIPKIGDAALAGVGVCGPIVTLLTSFGTLIGLGGSILMTMRMGAGRKKQAESILAHSFALLVVFSAVLTVLFLVSKRYLLNWFGASPATFPYADSYLTIYTAGTFFALLAIGLNYFITCQGFPAIGMITVLIGAVTNIILDPVFIFVLDMKVAGAAIATVIAQFASCAFAFCFLTGKKIPIKITRLRKKTFSPLIVKKIIGLGISPFLILATDSVIIIVLNTVLQKYGGPKEGDILITCATIVQSYMMLITGSHAGNFQRHPGHFKLQLRSQKHKTCKESGKICLNSLPVLYHADVPAFQNRAGILYTDFHQRCLQLQPLHLGNRCFHPDDYPPQLPVRLCGWVYRSWKKQNSPGTFPLAKGRLHAFYHCTSHLLWSQKRLLCPASCRRYRRCHVHHCVSVDFSETSGKMGSTALSVSLFLAS